MMTKLKYFLSELFLDWAFTLSSKHTKEGKMKRDMISAYESLKS